MDLEAAQSMKGKNSILDRLMVAFCLIVTAGLLISSLIGPSWVQTKQSRSAAPLIVQL